MRRLGFLARSCKEELCKHGYIKKGLYWYKVDLQGEYMIIITLRTLVPGRIQDIRIGVCPFANNVVEYEYIGVAEGSYHMENMVPMSGIEPEVEARQLWTVFAERVLPLLDEIRDEASCYQIMGQLDQLFRMSLQKDELWLAYTLGYPDKTEQQIDSLIENRLYWLNTMREWFEAEVWEEKKAEVEREMDELRAIKQLLHSDPEGKLMKIVEENKKMANEVGARLLNDLQGVQRDHKQEGNL